MAEEKKKGTEKKESSKKAATKKSYAVVKYCPKCGPGYRLANHVDRLSCGKCGYMEKKTTDKKGAHTRE